MRVAIYEPSPRVAGPVTWAAFVQRGFRGLGHECDVVTVTRSGRPSTRWGPGTGRVNRGWSWSTLVPDVVARDGSVFDNYDFVILTEPKSSPFDRWAQKLRGERGRRAPEKLDPDAEPLYVTWLRQTDTPWATALHGPQYQPGRAPFLEDLLALPNFTGHVMTTRRGFADTSGFLGTVTLHEHRPLPYVPRLPRDAGVPERPAFGMLGRAAANKGSQLLAYVAARNDLPRGWGVEIHGAGGIGAGPCFTYRLYSVLKRLGCEGSLEGGDVAPSGKLKALKPERWKVETPDGRNVTYWAMYEDTVATAGRFAVHVNLTEKKFSYGMIEFVGLEALDAGCVPVYPVHVLGAADYQVFELTKFTSPPPIRAVNNEPGSDFLAVDTLEQGVYRELTTQLANAVALVEHPKDRLELVRHNREVIYTVHDPRVLATRFLEECR